MSKKKKSAPKKRMQLPDGLGAEPKIETLGNREIIIDGVGGVVEYGENLIKLNAGNLLISIVGNELLIKAYDGSVAVISGQIANIEFVG